MMKGRMFAAIVAILVVCGLAPVAAEQKLADVELWAIGAVSEAGEPPADWVGYQIIKDKLGINLKIVLQPSSQTDQDTKISVAAAANSLPDIFGVNRDML